ncbi:MAG: SGNH/GDSL hydrolase family protein [Rhodanobacteraceae bacterium]
MSAHRPTGYLALGDSYTIGEGVAEHERWPVRLAQALDEQGHDLAAPEIIATTGWSTDELLAALADQALRPPYRLVSLLIGVNNQYRGRDVDNYRAEFSELLSFAVHLAGQQAGRVLVVSIPDWGVTPMARKEARDPQQIAAEIDAYNAVARVASAAAQARFVDITGISRACGDDLRMLVDDGLHPSAEQYALWLAPIQAAAGKCLAAG